MFARTLGCLSFASKARVFGGVVGLFAMACRIDHWGCVARAVRVSGGVEVLVATLCCMWVLVCWASWFSFSPVMFGFCIAPALVGQLGWFSRVCRVCWLMFGLRARCHCVSSFWWFSRVCRVSGGVFGFSAMFVNMSLFVVFVVIRVRVAGGVFGFLVIAFRVLVWCSLLGVFRVVVVRVCRMFGGVVVFQAMFSMVFSSAVFRFVVCVFGCVFVMCSVVYLSVGGFFMFCMVLVFIFWAVFWLWVLVFVSVEDVLFRS